MTQQFKIALLDDGATKMTCREAQCGQYERGWITVVDERTARGARQAHYIRAEAGRKFIEFPSEEAGEHLGGEMAMAIGCGLTVFKFYAGQPCFAAHADREVMFVHQEGERRRMLMPREFNARFNEEAAKAAERN